MLPYRYVQITKGAEKTGPMVSKDQLRDIGIYRLTFFFKNITENHEKKLIYYILHKLKTKK